MALVSTCSLNEGVTNLANFHTLIEYIHRYVIVSIDRVSVSIDTLY